MFIMHVLNDANEWELITRKFKTQFNAVKFFHKHLSMFADYSITKI